MIDIVLVESDPIINQASMRSEQIVKSLSRQYSVLALGWNRGEGIPNQTNSLKIFHLCAPYGNTLRYLTALPIFWAWIFVKLCIHRPKSVHACNLDTILPCHAYRLLFKKKLVFDVHDRYAMSFISRNKSFLFDKLYSFVNFLEEKYANKADLVICNYDKIFKTFKEKPRNGITIMNCPEDYMTNQPKTHSKTFRLLFTGHVRECRGLGKVLEILVDLKDIELIIMGRVEDEKLLEKVNQTSNTKYLGLLDRKEVIDYELDSDASLALYDKKLQSQHEYGMANKILEAMMCGLPVVTNIAHEIINEVQCGILVEYDNIQQIKEAITSLRDNPDLRKKLGYNGRKAFLEKYNWKRMEERLFKCYEELLK